jgi:ribosomal protein S6
MAEDIIKEEIAQDGADEAETQVYELGFHIVPSVEEGDVASEVDTIKALVEKNGGVFISEESPKLIDLAYTIIKAIEGKKERFDTAYFGWIKFEMKTDSIGVVKEEIDLNKNVLRYLIIKTVKESTLTPKTAVFAKEDVSRKPAPKTNTASSEKVEEDVKKADEVEKPVVKEKKEPVSEEDLDKTIEELVV